MEEKNTEKKQRIDFRISKNKKDKWKTFSKENGMTLSDLIISAVDNKLTNSEKRKILMFIEKQDNIFAKIENNINQFAYIANYKKDVLKKEMALFNQKLEEVALLKAQQNQIFKNIYKLLADDSKDS